MDVTIKAAQSLIENYFTDFATKFLNGEKVSYLPIFLHGAPGVGKSDITRETRDSVAQKLCDKTGKPLEIGLVDERLANFEPSDVSGIPYVSHAGLQTECMKFSIPSWVPTQERVDNGEFPELGILVLDEMSNASIQVQHASYRLILDRELHHGQSLAKGWIIICAGNRKEDKTGANDVKPALGNRFGCHLNVVTNIEIWTQWALRSDVNDKVIAFLNANPQYLHKFDAKNPVPNFPSPRTWSKTSEWMGVGLDEQGFMFAINGCVGDEAATQFQTYLKYYADMPNWQDLMDGKIKYKVKLGDKGLEIALTYALIQCIVDACQTDDVELRDTRIANLEAVLGQLPKDFIGLVYRQIKYTTRDDTFRTMLISTMDTFAEIADMLD